MDKIVQALVAKYWKDLKKKKNVNSFSGTLRPKITDGKEDPSIMCFRVYVEKKVDKDKDPEAYEALVKNNDLVPSVLSVGKEEICTDVVEIGKIKALVCGCPNRPVTPGCSAMNYNPAATACTLGGFGKSTKEGEENIAGVICNNHCGARENKASVGEPYSYPSKLDGGDASKIIAEHLRHVEIKFSEFTCPFRSFFHKIYRMFVEAPTNSVDISFEKMIIPEEEITLAVQNIGIPKGKRRGTEGELAHKHGRTTCYTTDGKLIDNDWYGIVGYSRGVALMGPCGLLEKNGFSAGGDSSSMILWKSDNFCGGFLFAGSDTHTVFCHYDYVESALEVEILTENGLS